MSAEHPAPSPARTTSRSSQLHLIAAGLGVAAVCVSGCATAAPYNPAGLGQAQFDRVAGACQTVLGLPANEPHIVGDGNPRLTQGENHYEGCIATLSGSLRSVADRAAVIDADRACRATGARSGGPALAECVLKSEAAPRPTPAASAPTLAPTPVAAALPARSFFWMGMGERSKRIELACAEIGLNPAYGAFDACVREMKDTFFAIDNPWN